MKIMLLSGPGKITQISKEIQKLAMAHNYSCLYVSFYSVYRHTPKQVICDVKTGYGKVVFCK